MILAYERKGQFHAAAAESPSFSGDAQIVDLQPRYNDLIKATRCSNSTDSLSCLRGLDVTQLQKKSPIYNWSPCIDNDILTAPLYELYEARRFRWVPMIYGSTTDEGTKNVDKTVNTSTLDAQIRSSLGNITDKQLTELKTMYPASLNNITFSGAKLNGTYPGAGNEWQRLAALMGDLSIRCIAAFHSDMHYANGNTQNWHYHYDIMDARDEATGNRVYHTVELNAIWGPNNTDGAPPPSYYTTNAGAVSILQSYWLSFIRTFDPNALKRSDLPVWRPWTLEGSDRLRFSNNETVMEKMSDAEMNRCDLVIQYAKARNAYAQPLTKLPPFANGTFPDPNL
jgi:carboxylesterase type B